jgi:hypothetical protein
MKSLKKLLVLLLISSSTKNTGEKDMDSRCCYALHRYELLNLICLSLKNPYCRVFQPLDELRDKVRYL